MATAFNLNIKALRARHELTQEQLGDAVGVDRVTVGKWEREEIHKPRSKEVEENLKRKYNLTDTDLYGFSDGLYAKHYGTRGMLRAEASETYAPVLGDIAAGDPREAIEYMDEKKWVPPEILERDPDAFLLRVGGDSMNRTPFIDGTYAVISPNTPVSNGDIAAVKVNGDEATLKVYKYFDGVITLEPRSDNPDYRRRIIDETDPDAPYVKVLGKAIWPYYPIKF